MTAEQRLREVTTRVANRFTFREWSVTENDADLGPTHFVDAREFVKIILEISDMVSAGEPIKPVTTSVGRMVDIRHQLDLLNGEIKTPAEERIQDILELIYEGIEQQQ